MSDNPGATRDQGALVENFAAELTGAAYPTALRHWMRGSWIEMELALWKALAETVKRWAGERLAGSSDDFKIWRDGLVTDLTEGAFYVVAKYGIRGSRLEVEADLYRGFRLVIRRRYGARYPK